MPKVLIVYATTDGHTRKVAEFIAKTATEQGCSVSTFNAKLSKDIPLLETYDRTIVAASIHIGNFQRAIKLWVHHNIESLKQKPSAFIPVCLGVAQNRPESDLEIKRIVDCFFEKTKWQPSETLVVAGALPYTRYNFLKKLIMKRIARKANGGTDTSSDYEYTDWAAVAKFTRAFVSTNTIFPRVQGSPIVKDMAKRRL